MLLGSAYATRKNWLAKAVISKGPKYVSPVRMVETSKTRVSNVDVDSRYFCMY